MQNILIYSPTYISVHTAKQLPPTSLYFPVPTAVLPTRFLDLTHSLIFLSLSLSNHRLPKFIIEHLIVFFGDNQSSFYMHFVHLKLFFDKCNNAAYFHILFSRNVIKWHCWFGSLRVVQEQLLINQVYVVKAVHCPLSLQCINLQATPHIKSTMAFMCQIFSFLCCILSGAENSGFVLSG